MNDPTDSRSKADASHRLAELAKTPRARELFRQLAEEYEMRAKGGPGAELLHQAEAAPSLVPVASLVGADVPASDQLSPAVVPTVPLAPSGPMSDTAQWLANLAAARGEA